MFGKNVGTLENFIYSEILFDVTLFFVVDVDDAAEPITGALFSYKSLTSTAHMRSCA